MQNFFSAQHSREKQDLVQFLCLLWVVVVVSHTFYDITLLPIV